ncbi:MAG TPA: LysE family translocator [candidate division Zixibacteria bacterium]|nr:LysE family translocator [candidate division Zixibacteria bacterium]
MFDQSVLAFSIAALILTLTPGNDTVLVMRNTISGHKAAGFATMFGICCGTVVHGLFASLGISVILMKSATLFQIVKFVGAGYLIFLGGQSFYSAWKIKKENKTESVVSSNSNKVSPHRCFMQGLMTNVLNPKVALFYLSFIPQFIHEGDPVFKPLFLACIHIVMGIGQLSTVILMITKLRKFLVSPKVRAGMEAVCGTMLTGFGIKLALQK